MRESKKHSRSSYHCPLRHTHATVLPAFDKRREKRTSSKRHGHKEIRMSIGFNSLINLQIFTNLHFVWSWIRNASYFWYRKVVSVRAGDFWLTEMLPNSLHWHMGHSGTFPLKPVGLWKWKLSQQEARTPRSRSIPWLARRYIHFQLHSMSNTWPWSRTKEVGDVWPNTGTVFPSPTKNRTLSSHFRNSPRAYTVPTVSCGFLSTRYLQYTYTVKPNRLQFERRNVNRDEKARFSTCRELSSPYWSQ